MCLSELFFIVSFKAGLQCVWISFFTRNNQLFFHGKDKTTHNCFYFFYFYNMTMILWDRVDFCVLSPITVIVDCNRNYRLIKTRYEENGYKWLKVGWPLPHLHVYHSSLWVNVTCNFKLSAQLLKRCENLAWNIRLERLVCEARSDAQPITILNHMFVICVKMLTSNIWMTTTWVNMKVHYI